MLGEQLVVPGWRWEEVPLAVFHALVLPQYDERGHLDRGLVTVYSGYTGVDGHTYTSWCLVAGRVAARNPGSDEAAQVEGRVPLWCERFPVDRDLNRTGPTRVAVVVRDTTGGGGS